MKSYLELQTGTVPMLIEMAEVQEVMSIAASLVVPVANMPRGVMGMVAHHQQVYWVVDLSKFLHLDPMGNISKYAITILSKYALAIATESIGTIKNLEYPLNSDQKQWVIPEPSAIFAELDKLTRH